LRTGELLIEEGLIKDEDIRMALEIQERHNREKIAPLIGGILCQWNMVTPFDLFYTLHKHGKLLRVGDILMRDGKVTASQLDEALSFQNETSKPFGEILVEKKFTAEPDLYHALARQGNIPFMTLNDFCYKEGDVNILSHFTGFDFVSEKKIIPLEYCYDTLTVAILKPHDMSELASLAFKSVMFRIKCVLIPKERHQALFNAFWDVKTVAFPVTGAESFSKKMPVIVIHDPDSEIVKIDAMYHRYTMMKTAPGQIENESNSLLFREFIRENHERIRNQFKCSQVSYQLEKKDEKVLIQAFPVTN